jgi:SAM-dependent methyltransferase
MILFVFPFSPLFYSGTVAHDVQYDRARPTYPAEALHAIHDALPTSGPLTVLEPGSGTGIFTRLVLSPPEKYPNFDIKTLIGVEPSSGMREAWQKGLDKLPKQAIEGKKVESVDGTFDDFSKAGLREGEADAVIIAQAFHWCPDYEGALVCPPYVGGHGD